MTRGGISALFMGLTALACTLVQADGMSSSITHLRQGCNLISAEGAVPRESLCAGEGDYGIVVSTDPLRENLWIESAAGKVDLRFAKTVSPAPSRLGDNVEWRMNGGKPVALIATLSTDTNPSDTQSPTPSGFDENSPSTYEMTYLVVVKLDPTASCVVEKIPTTGKDDDFTEARKVADAAQGMSCLVIPPAPQN